MTEKEQVVIPACPVYPALRGLWRDRRKQSVQSGLESMCYGETA